MSIQLKTPAEIAKLREANLIVAEVLDTLEAAAKPGMIDLGAERDRRPAAQAAQGASRRSSATTATRPCSARRSTRWSSTASRASDVVLKDGRHHRHRLRRLQGRLLRRLRPDHPDRRRSARGRAGPDARPPARRWSWRSRSASRATGWATSAGRSSRTSRHTAIRWSGSSSATASAGRCTRSPTSRTTGEPGKGKRLNSRAGDRHRAHGKRREPRGRGPGRRVDGGDQRW